MTVLTRTTTHTLVLCVALVSGCAEDPGDTGELPPPPRAGVPTAASDPHADVGGERIDTDTDEGWTIRAVSVDREVQAVATAIDARLALNHGFDRLVLEFEGDEIPSYRVEYVDGPIRQCGSGDPVSLAGNAFLIVRLQPARAHDSEGRAAIAERESTPGLPVILESRIICDFEAHLDWALGVTGRNAIRVMELMDPARLVVDVRH